MRSWRRQIGCLNPANRFYPNIFTGNQNQALTLLSRSAKPLCIPCQDHQWEQRKAIKAKIGTFGGALQGHSQNYAKPTKLHDPADLQSLLQNNSSASQHMLRMLNLLWTYSRCPSFIHEPLSPVFFTQRQDSSCLATQLFVKQLCLFPKGKKKKTY